VKLVVEARDPSDGATVMVICLTRREVLGAVQILRQERFESIALWIAAAQPFLRALWLSSLQITIPASLPVSSRTGHGSSPLIRDSPRCAPVRSHS
jgi:hypothetical protein